VQGVANVEKKTPPIQLGKGGRPYQRLEARIRKKKQSLVIFGGGGGLGEYETVEFTYTPPGAWKSKRDEKKTGSKKEVYRPDRGIQNSIRQKRGVELPSRVLQGLGERRRVETEKTVTGEERKKVAVEWTIRPS